MGYTAADTVERIPQDSRSLKIQAILMQQCGINFENSGKVAAAREEEGRGGRGDGPLFFNLLRKLFYGDGDWVTQMRANLSLVPTIVATITFQAAVNPPGGVIQQNILNSGDNKTVTSSTDYPMWRHEGPLGCLQYINKKGALLDELCPGDAILSHTRSSSFNNFMIFNTISFVESVFLAFLLVSGIPLKSRSMMWVLNLGMLSSLSFLLNAYLAGISLIFPQKGNRFATIIIFLITWAFNAFCLVVAAYIVVKRLVVAFHKKRNTSREAMQGLSRSPSNTVS